MMTVKIRPGDTVELVAMIEKPTPFGSKETETIGLRFTYEELLSILKLRGRLTYNNQTIERSADGQPKNTNEEGNSTYTSEPLTNEY
jgi:hypothetical protein